MIYLLTSNDIQIRNIKSYSENFIISLLHSQTSKFHRTPTQIFQYDIFTQDALSPDLEDCESSDGINFDIHEHPTITSALDEIAQMLMDGLAKQQARSEDLREEITIACCCTYDGNQQIVKHLNEIFSDADSNELIGKDLVALNLYNQLRVGSKARIAELLRSLLNTEFIYPDDPISFGYALNQVLVGGMI
jgi:hypothetical protein